MYIATDKDNRVTSFVIIGKKPNVGLDGHVYNVEPTTVPKEFFDDVINYYYDGITFTKVNKQSGLDQYIENIRSNKIAWCSALCNKQIIKGIDYGEYHYSLENEDQINITRLAMEAKSENPAPLVYHGDGEEIRVYSPTEILELFDKMNTWINYNISYYNIFKQYVQTIEEVSVLIDRRYNQTFPEPYNSQLNSMVDISKYDDFPIAEIPDENDYVEIYFPTVSGKSVIDSYFEEKQQEFG